MTSDELIRDFATMLRLLAKRSVCKRRGVACIVVNQDMQSVGWGVNGPAGYEPSRCDGTKDGCGCAHSEINTILNCRPSSYDAETGCIMIASRAPCVPCATAIVNCGLISEFIYLDDSEPGPKGIALLKCFMKVTQLEDMAIEDPLREQESAADRIAKDILDLDDPKLPDHWKRCGDPESETELGV